MTQADYIDENYVSLLRKYLEKKYSGNYIQVYNLGIAANTTGDILKRFETESSFRNPTDVIFQVGVNDSGYFQTENNAVVFESDFKKNLKKLIIKAREITDNVAFVSLAIGDEKILQPFNNDPTEKWFNSERVKKYDGMIKNIAESSSCKHIALFDKLSPSDFLDGLHPNQSGHQKMFEEIKKYF